MKLTDVKKTISTRQEWVEAVNMKTFLERCECITH